MTQREPVGHNPSGGRFGVGLSGGWRFWQSLAVCHGSTGEPDAFGAHTAAKNRPVTAAGSDAADAAYFHFIEMDNNGALIEAGQRFDYKSLDQWQNWTGQDFNSVIGNFTNEFTFLGNAQTKH